MTTAQLDTKAWKEASAWPAWNSDARQGAEAWLLAHGFDTKGFETWKYTRFDPTGLQAPSAASGQESGVTLQGVEQQGVKVYRGDRVPEELRSLFGSLGTTHEEPLHALSLVGAQELILIDVAPNTLLNEPILIDTREAAPHTRVYIRAGEGSQGRLVEYVRGVSAASTYATEVAIEDRGHWCYQREEDGSKQARLSHVDLRLGRQAVLEGRWLLRAGKTNRTRANIGLAGEGSACRIQGLMLGTAKEHLDLVSVVHHQAPHTSSRFSFKGVAAGGSTLVFNAKALVDDVAQKTYAVQENKNLLLAKSANAYTRPQMEIYADDVKCAHGATVGQTDAEQLFYLQARGIPEELARDMLAEAFGLEYLEDGDFPGLEALVTRAKEALRGLQR